MSDTSKEAAVLNSFTKDFVEFSKTDTEANIVIEMLIRGIDPYQIIENLVFTRSIFMEEYRKLLENSTPVYLLNQDQANIIKNF